MAMEGVKIMSIRNYDQTSKRVASEASSILRSKTAGKTAKSVAGSALVQAPHKDKVIPSKKKTSLAELMK